MKEDHGLNYMWGVIYSIDCYAEEHTALAPFLATSMKNHHLWRMTENEPDESEVFKHRKYCAVLTQQQFDEFVDEIGLYAENVQTMGALGMPGAGNWWGWSPAISFTSRDNFTEYGALCNAYVCPFDPEWTEPQNEEKWEEVRRQVIDAYEN